MNIDKIKNANTKILGKNVIYYDEISSTQDIIRNLAEKHVENGTIVIADNQVDGKGTKGRTWVSEKNKNITMSLIMYPNCKVEKLEGLTIEDGMKLLKQRGYLMGNLVPDEKYAMAAVIGLKASIIEEMCNKKIMEGKFVVQANYNYSGQIVISGNEETIEECIEEFKEKGAKKVIKLKTSGPFHTIKLQKASEEFAKCLQNVQFNEPKVDIIKNLDGRIYSKEDNINQILEKHIISPVRFDKAIDLMNDIGIEAYVEIGPGKALSGFVKRELEDANVYTLNNLDSLNKFLENFE